MKKKVRKHIKFNVWLNIVIQINAILNFVYILQGKVDDLTKIFTKYNGFIRFYKRLDYKSFT